MQASAVWPRTSWNLTGWLVGASEPLLFGIRLWASVCLALYVAFWLQLDSPFWAGTSAAVVCQPQLGASLRKGWFRIIGTLVGATMVVGLTACFPQDRIAFLGGLALWASLCAFAATVLRNFASYSAALAGYTATIIAADNLGATGGPSADIFMLAITRASEICIGIVCAGVVLAGTDFGDARLRLAASFANLTAGIAGRFTRMLALAGPQLPDTQAERRELVRRVIALDPLIDQAIGESGQLRYHAPTLQAAVHGLFKALDGWRGVATHLSRVQNSLEQQGLESILRSIPLELRSAQEAGSPERCMADPAPLRRVCEEAVRTLLAMPLGTPALRLLADEAAKVVAGILHAMDGLALLVDSGRPFPVVCHRAGPIVADWLPALVNFGRAFLAIGAVELFWVFTTWPNGGSAIIFVATIVLLLSPKGDMAFGGAIAFSLGCVGAVVGAAIIEFAVLPALETFPAFCLALGIYLIPAGFAVARIRHPAILPPALTAMAVNFAPLLAPTNQMNYNTEQFYNTALAILLACAAAALSFRLVPPVSPALRARRLLASTLRDLRRLAIDPLPLRLEDWESRMYGRLGALPDQAEPLQRGQLLAGLSAGTAILDLRHVAARLDATAELGAALEAFANGQSGTAIGRLRQLDHRVASGPSIETAVALRARGRFLALSEVLAEHHSYFDAGAPA